MTGPLHIIELLLLPPASGLIIAMTGLLLWRRRAGALLMFSGLLWIYVAATPLFAGWLLRGLEGTYQTEPSVPAEARAIVVLGGGRHGQAPEYGLETVNHATLERLRYAALLHRRTGLPLLVTGGRVRGDEPSAEAELMAKVLEREFGVMVSYRESASRTTWENAVHSARILRSEGLDHVLLVTHALHMPRAVWSFRQSGIAVTPFPTLPAGGTGPDPGADSFIPQPRALWQTGQALHEYLGSAWYWARVRLKRG